MVQLTATLFAPWEGRLAGDQRRAQAGLDCFSAAMVTLMSPAPRALTTCIVFSSLILLASCSRFDRANQARAEEIKKLSHQTFRQAAEFGRCDRDECSRQEAGFAYAKKNGIANPDGCSGKGDEDFVEGCRQYGEDIDAAYRRIAGEA